MLMVDELSREIGRLEGLLDPKSSGETIDELTTIRRGLNDQRRPPVRLPNLRLGFQCKERWDDMVGDDRVRACCGCHRPVFNLSAMTHDEAEQLLSTRGLTPCVRFYRRADGTVMTTDCPTSARERRRLAVVASSIAAGTTLASPIAHAEPASVPPADIDATTGQPVAIAGVISDQTSNQPLAGVTVVASSSASGQTFVVITDERGMYRITDAPPGAYIVTFYYADLTVEGNVEVTKGKVAHLSQTLDVNQSGEVINISMGLPEMGLPDSPQRTGITLQQDYLMGIPVSRTFGSVVEQPAVEWSVWGRLGMGTANQHPSALARGLTPLEPQIGAIFETALSAELTIGIANDRKIRLGAWGELRTTSGPVVGGELVVTGLPPHPMASQIAGSGMFVMRAGANAHVITGALGFGYTGSFARTDQWLAHAVGARLITSVNRSLDDPRDWSATLGLEVEPLGAVQAMLRLLDD